ncbi:cob(I)yrinic acid a,c-diamide adenosyltransferase [Paraperlucidibaca wandonensis]|jgi:cob(I)alamin adenosyltransferase|uniref:Corrinoid adenosyltransferase n=1 Tax=Paraperlucidibaca wandonensis TaxID=1268273 RepID=A0ABW3HBD6_9GAMM
MGNRLTKIYTRTGDDGTTGLGDGSRVRKDALRVEAYGTVDETNAQVGMLRAALAADHSAQIMLEHIQHDLFDVGGELCIPGYELVTAAYVERLESAIDAVNAELPALKDFILPGGSPAAAAAHVARTVSRRAERRTLTLADAETVNPQAIKYLNRLSDYFFVLARQLARADGGNEVLWRKRSG